MAPKREPSLKNQLFFLVALVFFAMAIIFVVVSSRTNGVIHQNRKQDIEILLSQVHNNVSLSIERYSVLLYNLQYSSSIQKFMTAENDTEYSRLALDISRDLKSFRSAIDGVLDIFILGEINSYSTGSRIKKLPDNIERPDNSFLHLSPVYFLPSRSSETETPYFCIYSQVPVTSGMSPKTDPPGWLLIAVTAEGLNATLPGISQDTGITYYFIDSADVVFSSNRPGAIGEKARNYLPGLDLYESGRHVELRDSYVTIDVLSDLNMRFAIELSKDSIWKSVLSSYFAVFAVIFLLMLIIGVLSSYLLKRIIQPMNRMMDILRPLNEGNLKVLRNRVEVEGYYEITVMVSAFNGMLDEIQSLTHRLISSTQQLYQMEITKKELELAYLRSQINPHFLYNSLETIRGMACLENAAKTASMSGALGCIFRYSIKGEATVELAAEMEMAQAYLLIHKYRFGDRLNLIYKIQEEALTFLIPKMILQPIVENAVLHAVENSSAPIDITIAAYLHDEHTLCLDICDTGCGMSQIQLATVRRAMSLNSPEEGAGMGFRNIFERLRLEFGERYTFTIDSAEHAGTQVYIRIPARTGL